MSIKGSTKWETTRVLKLRKLDIRKIRMMEIEKCGRLKWKFKKLEMGI